MKNQKLEMLIEYDNMRYDETFIKIFGNKYVDTLKSLISYCIEKENVELTPSDLTYSDLSMEDLNNIF